ncbi:MAG: hypothetical protein WCJ72_12310, partial [Chryseobacterium sp.]
IFYMYLLFFSCLVKIFIYNNKIIQIIQRNKKLFLISLFFPIIMAFGSQLRGDVENINLKFIIFAHRKNLASEVQ